MDGRDIYRDASGFKLANNVINNDGKAKEPSSRASEETEEDETRRDDLFKAPIKENK